MSEENSTRKIPLESRMARYGWATLLIALVCMFVISERSPGTWAFAGVLLIISAMFGCTSAVIKALKETG